MVTTRNVIIGFELLCECVFSFSANVKGHRKLSSTSNKINACFHDYQQHCDFHKRENGVHINRTDKFTYHPVLVLHTFISC